MRLRRNCFFVCGLRCAAAPLVSAIPMKMETNVVARMAGTVEQVLIKEGGSVKAGELLITIK